MEGKWDFHGWATKNDVKCADGLTIRRDAFKHDDGQIVPLVYMHDHENPLNVLGHVLLENKPEGVLCHAKFNNSEEAQHVKECVMCGDLNSLSIYAKNVKKSKSGDVIHGNIKEVSVVLAGANPEAVIDTPVIVHSLDSIYDDDAVIYSGDYIELDEEFEHADEKEEKSDSKGNKTIGSVLATLSEEQMKAVAQYASALADEAVKEALGNSDENNEDEEDVKHDNFNEGDGSDMKHNIFDTDTEEVKDEFVISHSDMKTIIDNAKRGGSLKQAFDDFCEDNFEFSHDYPENPYGIMSRGDGTYGLEALYPDYRNVTDMPIVIDRKQDWVSVVLNGVKHLPFARVKTMMADITDDEARAKGYIKGTRKKDEVFTLLKRTTDPQTIYKKQRFDRDDLIDITDLDVIAWVKEEMRGKLNEEMARAILIGDGRQSSNPDKIQEVHIRPIVSDDDLFTIKKTMEVATGEDRASVAKRFIREAVKARKEYRGSGTPTLFTSSDLLTEMLLLEDAMGRRLYPTMAELTTALRANAIVEVPFIDEGLTETTEEKLEGVFVSLSDYAVGNDKGGEVNMFADFDINFNQQVELLETRCSGALIKPFSAIVIKTKAAS